MIEFICADLTPLLVGRRRPSRHQHGKMSADMAGKGLGSLLQILAGAGPQDRGQQLPQDVALRVKLGLGLDASLPRQPSGNVWRPLQKARECIP